MLNEEQQQQQYSHADLFPPLGEYDPGILDPYHIYGAPFGGFSRATRSRLASLPLHLPEIAESNVDTDAPLFFEVRDDLGRLFACRAYNEDELLLETLTDSMFDPPRLRVAADEGEAVADASLTLVESDETIATPLSSIETDEVEDGGRSVIEEPQDETQSMIESAAADSPGMDSTTMSEGPPVLNDHKISEQTMSATITSDASFVENTDDQTSHDSTLFLSSSEDEDAVLETKSMVGVRLSELELICGQIHTGWWSYEWCYQQSVSQFHLEYDAIKNKINVDSLTDLGMFTERIIETDLTHAPTNELAQEIPELARVVDIHNGGGECKETGQLRKTFAHLQCCSDDIMQQNQGLLHKGGRQVTSDIAAVISVQEDPNMVCTYNMTICTPLLCRGDNREGALSSLDASMAAALSLESEDFDENESIREILDRTLQELCLQSNNGGWWTYEFCHKQTVRQFHELISSRRHGLGAKLTSKGLESEHILGVFTDFDTSETLAVDDWKLVVNVSDIGIVGRGNSWGDGNGAYYDVEYFEGDVCDHSDVTSSAIVAGSTKAGGGVERSSTVRFYCGQSYDIVVNEDSTCHYVVQVKVPFLCKHPLFRAPAMKKQIIKCLPIDGE